MKILNLLVITFSLFLVACSMIVENLGNDTIKTETEQDKLVAIGQVKSDGRFTVIGDKYLYVINDKNLNNFLMNESKKSLQKYDIENRKVIINLKKDIPNKGELSLTLIDLEKLAAKEKAGIGFTSEIELYQKIDNIPQQYIFKKNVVIDIKRQEIVSYGHKSLSTVLTPFAFATDIALMPVYVFIWGISGAE